MKEIILKVPDTFTQSQIDEIRSDCLELIAEEMRKSLVFPKAEVDAKEAEITEIKNATHAASVVKP